MNIQNTRLMTAPDSKQLTAAEQALADSFADHAMTLPGDDRVSAIRRTQAEAFRTLGLPSRRVEAWHYTDLRTLLKSIPVPRPTVVPEQLEPLVQDTDVVSVMNGQAARFDMPEGVTRRSYRDMLIAGTVSQMGAQSDDDVIGRINGAFVTDGHALEIEAGTTLQRVLELQVLHGGGQAHTRFPVTVGAGASGVFIERHTAVADEGALVSSITDLDVGDDAKVVWIILQEQGLSDTHFGQINVRLGTNASLTLFVANAGGHLVRQEIHLTADGEGSELALSGVNLLAGTSHTDVTMTLDHLVPNCESSETFRNVVFDRARGVFQGQIKVAQIAQKTDARMACNTLLLSDNGDFSSKPELEIFADDVQCAHGATVTDIDENQLFYLMARGIGEKKARAMLVKAFIAEIVEELDHETLVEALEARFETWLDTHG